MATRARKHWITAGITVLVIVLLAGNALPLTRPAPLHAQDAQNSRLQIVASFSILADVVANVAGDAADVETLIPLGANPHAYEPSARDIATLSDADMVIVAGLNFEESLLPVVQEATGGSFYEVWGCIPLRAIEAEHTDHEHGEQDHESDGATLDPDNTLAARCGQHYDAVRAGFGLEEVAAPGAQGPLYENPACVVDEHLFGNCDPHVWTDPVNVGLWALMIRDMLSAADPANADVYAAHTAAYLDQLAALDTGIQGLIAGVPEDRRVIVTNHLTFNYFAARYGLAVIGVVIPGGSTTSEPTVQDVLALIETIQAYSVPALFTETTVSEDLAQQIADEAGAGLVRLYTGSLSDSDGPASTYLDYMRFNASQIAGALK